MHVYVVYAHIYNYAACVHVYMYACKCYITGFCMYVCQVRSPNYGQLP